jgi:Peptidase family M23
VRITKHRLFVWATAIAAGLAPLAFAPAEPALAAGPRPPFQLPFPCGQQWRMDTWSHAPALDMVKEPNQVGTEGALLVAPAAGTVNQSFFHSNAGNMIQINHGGGWFTTYIHLQSRSVGVGAVVSQGQEIGRVGRTGPTSNNHPHLHYELAIDANGNGSATWGYAGSERVPAWFNGVQYGTANGQTYRNVTSNNRCTNPTPGKFWVDTFANAPVFASATSTTQTGTLYAGTNYVYCRVWGREIRDSSGAFNHWWLKTDPDEGPANQYVSAYYLSRWGNDVAKDNNGVDIPNC